MIHLFLAQKERILLWLIVQNGEWWITGNAFLWNILLTQFTSNFAAWNIYMYQFSDVRGCYVNPKLIQY